MARKLILAVVGALALLAFLEGVLRLLPTPGATSTGRYIDSHLTTYPPGHRFTSATGWMLLNSQAQEANEYGYIPNDPYPASSDAVALIGDSIVEQSMLPPSHRLASLLREARGGRPVYSMGMPGSSLFDYVERARFASDKLRVRSIWIVVEAADVRESICGSGVYLDACLGRDGHVVDVPPVPRSALKAILAHSALLQYFVGVLRISPEGLLNAFQRKAPPRTERTDSATPALSTAEEAVIEAFISAILGLEKVDVALVIDPGVSRLARPDEFLNPQLRSLYQRAKEAGIVVIHPHRALSERVEATRLSPKVGPYDAHWNVMANCIVTAVILDNVPGEHRAGSKSVPPVCVSLEAQERLRP